MQFTVPTFDSNMTIDIDQGTSAIFVGANGAGKSRLAIHIESVGGEHAHRISAHRALKLDTSIPKIREEDALRGLRFGETGEYASLPRRNGGRWNNNPGSVLLDDFNFVIQALFAEQARTSLNSHNRSREGNTQIPEPTKFEILQDIWDQLLPHRKLIISGDDIKVKQHSSESLYNASDMSDGERAIFYLIGQVLLAAENSLLIIDEPELHVHRSIMNTLWDRLESSRSDCAFVFITHDLEFAAGRVAQKFAISEYTSEGPKWKLESIPDDTGFSEELTTLILGSRKPILFVEGDANSLDKAVYRSAYPEWTVIPRGSCQNVIHAVSTLRANQSLTRVQCAGIIDADGYDASAIAHFEQLGVSVLPVSEIENLFLLPEVSRAIAATEHLSPLEIEERLNNLTDDIMTLANNTGEIESRVIMYCTRRIDQILKKTDLSKLESIEDIKDSYTLQTQSLDIDAIAEERRTKLTNAIAERDITSLLAIFDNKGMLAKAASRLKNTGRAPFESWLARILLSNKAPDVTSALREVLPNITVPQSQPVATDNS